MKLLVDTRGKRVLFAEASNCKEVVDFLFSLLPLLLIAVAMLLGPDGGVSGSVGCLYRSIASLQRSFGQPGANLNALLCPTVPPAAAGCLCPLLLRLPERPGGRTPGGFVHGNMTYMVRDDLAVAPMSTISSISVFNALAEMGGLGAMHEKRTVQIGHAEVLKILKASLESKTVLTDVFLGDVRAPAPGTLAR